MNGRKRSPHLNQMVGRGLDNRRASDQRVRISIPVTKAPACILHLNGSRLSQR